MELVKVSRTSLVSAPWLSTGYDGLWATTDHARTVDADGNRWHRTGDVGHLDTNGLLWVEGRLVHVVWTVEGPITSVPLEVAVEPVVAARCAVTGVGPKGCQHVVVVVERDGNHNTPHAYKTQ